jgi:hypothetical protein
MNTGSGIEGMFIGHSVNPGRLVQILDYRTDHKLVLDGF